MFWIAVGIVAVCPVLGRATAQARDARALPEESEAIWSGQVKRWRVQALSSTLLRIEEEGAFGFENRSTFMVRNRSWPGVPVTATAEQGGMKFVTDYFSLLLQPIESGDDCNATLTDQAGTLLWSTNKLSSTSSHLSGPEPSEVSATSVLAIRDAPRFVPPPNGATPASVPPQLKNTSGFDVWNHANDVYIVMATHGYSALRAEFLTLTGNVPMLPDWAFGLWFTWYHPYNQSEKVAEVQKFLDDDLGLEVASLDRGWREGGDDPRPHLPQEADYVVNKDLFPDMDGFISWLHGKGIRMFFNDHPKYLTAETGGGGSMKPTDVLSPDEVQFRWNGLTSMMRRGLDFWWDDCHWAWFAPALEVPGGGSVDGVTWGQAVFHDVEEQYKKVASPATDTSPMIMGCAESPHPAAHRYPVWWTGDIFNTDLTKSVGQMIEAGYKMFKPFVHPDCGGHHGHNEPEVYVRWIQFCSLGTIFRVHSDPSQDRRPWHYGTEVENIFRNYSKMRLSLVPALVSAAAKATDDGTPLVQRLDFEWPSYSEAKRMDQFLLAGDTLVAPIDPFPGGLPSRTTDFNRSRSMWIPPGEWTDAFSGQTVQGPQTLTRQDVPLEQMPMYHRRGGIVVTAGPVGRVAQIDWSDLVLNCWPNSAHTTSTRELHRPGQDRTVLTLQTALLPEGRRISLRIEQESQTKSAWLVRLHLLVGERVTHAQVDGADAGITHVQPLAGVHASPFRGDGARPGHSAGPTVEVRLEAEVSATRVVTFGIADATSEQIIL